MNVGFYNFILKRNIYHKMIETTSQKKKKDFKVRKINMTAKDKRPMPLFSEQVFDS